MLTAALTVTGLPWSTPAAEALIPSALEATFNPEGIERDTFGLKADLDGDTAVVGFERRDERVKVVEQSVRVFRRTGTAWASEATIPVPSLKPANRVKGLEIDGDTIVAATFNGPTYVFVRSGTAWTQQAVLSPGDGGAGLDFGASAALDGNTIVVGAQPKEFFPTANSGAYVFKRTGTTWAETAKLTVPGETSAGHIVALSAGTLAMRSSSAIHVFVRELGLWSLQASLDPADTTALAISGDTIVAGAPVLTGGTARVFTRSGTSWALQAELVASPDADATVNFGHAVAVDGDLAFIAADRREGDGGKLYAFKRSGSTWAAEIVPSPSGLGTDSRLGSVTAISGTTALAAAMRNNVLFGVTPKPVFVYRLNDPTASVPGAPTGVTATTGATTTADIAWEAPASDGGALITGYLITASPGGATTRASYPARSARVTGLTNGLSYTFTVTATNGVGDGPPSAPSNPVEPRPVVIVDDATAFEGDSGSALVPVSVHLSDPSADTVVVTLSSADGKAVAGEDYTAATRTVTFPPGEVLAPRPMWAVHGDATQEADERFRIDISATNATLARPSATVTIFDDDVPPQSVNRTVRVDVDPVGGAASVGPAGTVAFDSSGRTMAFLTRAANLGPGDANGTYDVFVRSLDDERTAGVSVTPGGLTGNGQSALRANCLSAEGDILAFSTAATDLTGTPDGNNALDAVVRNLTTGQSELVSVTPTGSVGNGATEAVAISPDGRYVLLASSASNLVTGDTNGKGDVFVRDLVTGITTRASLATGGIEPNDHSFATGFSLDGRYVLFVSRATNLPGRIWGDWYLRDLVAGTTHALSTPLPADQHMSRNFGVEDAALSITGRFVAFETTDQERTPTSQGLWLFDNQAGTTRAITATGDGVWRGGFTTLIAMSRKGDVLFTSGGRDYMYDRRAGTTRAFPGGLRARAIAPGGRVAIAQLPPPLAGTLEDYVFVDLDTFATAPVPLARGLAVEGPHGTLTLSNDGTHFGFIGGLPITYQPRNRVLVASTAAISVDEASGRETDGTIPVTVRLKRPSGAVVKVHYATENGSAGSGDYTPVAGVLRFERGVTELTVDVPVAADGVAEGDETFGVVLSSPVRGLVLDGRAVVTIRN